MATLACVFCTLFPWRRLRLGDGGGSFAAARWADFSRPSEAGDNGPRHGAQLCPVGLQWRGPGQELVRFKMNIQKHIVKLSSNWEKWIPIQEPLSIQNILPKFLQWYYGNALLPDSFPAPFHGNAHGKKPRMVAWTALARLCVACVWFLKGVRTLEPERLCRWPGLWQTQGVQDISRHFVLVLFSDCKILVCECVGISLSVSHNSAWEIRGSRG